ncbi:MAG: ArsR family transcriptional regulator [Actinobacteria bacterium]|nr:ArsR family transcriptional regulator [Actinomycetota bacterium]
MKKTATALAPFLRSQTQGIILASILSEPDVEFSLSELAKKANKSQPTIWREIDRAQKAGLVTTRKVGNSILVRADQSSRIYKPMREIMVAAFGAPAIVAEEFANIHGVDALILFGSWAARFRGIEGRSPNDLDILVLGNPNRAEIHDVGDQIESKLNLPVQITIRSVQEWNQPDPFLSEVKERPLLVLSTNSKTKDLELMLERKSAKR